jgi:putative nucleotidyltransferase with HDIG domain
LANKGDPIPKKQLLKYKKKNLQFLHVLKDEFSEFVGFNMKVLSALEKESDVKEEKVNNFINYTNAILMENTFLNELGEDEIDEILEYSSLTFSILKKQKSLFKLLQNLAENHEPVYAHSLSTAVLSYLIAKKVGWTTEPVLFKIFLASLLHDIGKRDVSPEILNKNPAFFTVEEKEEYESHPQRGMEILNALGGLQSEVILAAYQHHENCVGKGYPLGLTKQKISPISRLISCTDIICDHLIGNKKITLKNYQQGMIEVLKFKRKSYDPLFLNALAEILEINLDEF